MISVGIIFALITAFCFAWSSLFIKKGMAKASTESGVFYTIIVNTTIFLLITPFLIFRGLPQLNTWGLGLFILSGILGPVFGRFTLYGSIRCIGATRSASIKITSPVFSAILAWILLSEILSLQMILAIGIIIGGIYLVISSPVGTTNDQSLSKSGFILGFLAAFFFAATNVSRKAGINFIPSAIVGSAFSSLAALLAFTIYYWTKKSLKEILYVEKESLIKFCLGGVLASGALFSYFMALKFVSVSVAMAVANIEPLFTILLAHFSGINDEPITFKFISGAIIVVIGVALLILS